MTSTAQAQPESTIHNRVSAFKNRLSIKKMEAEVLYSEIITANKPEHRVKNQLETIRDALFHQQQEDKILQLSIQPD